MQEIIDRMGEEMAEVSRPIMQRMLATQTLPDDMHEMLTKAASGKHQWQSTVLTVLGMTGATSALGTIISNEAYPVTRGLIADNPHLVPAPPDLADLVARGLHDESDAQFNAAGQGFNADWFGAMIQATASYPGVSDIQELYRRGQLPRDEAIGLMVIQKVPLPLAELVLGLSSQLISPADAALAVLRGNMSLEDGNAIAAENGLDGDQFQVLIGNTGEPPGVMDMLAMNRRGIIDQQQLVRGILQSRLRDEWVPAIEAYGHSPMPTADAIDALVQNHLTDAEARAIADQNGLLPDQFDALVASAGEPLSKTEMLTLYKRKEVTADQVKQALRESRLKDKYVDQAMLLATTIPPLFEIKTMLTSGSITDALATTLLADDGYQPDVIKAILASAHKTKTVKVKTITEGMLSELYQERAITAVQFTTALVDMGYTKAEAAEIQQVDDWRIAKANRDAAISHIRSVYVGHKIDSALAQSQLDALLVPSDMRDKLMNDWAIEIQSAVKILTEAQIVDARFLGLIDTKTAVIKLMNLGYSGDDAGLLLEIKFKGPVPAN